LKLGLDMHYRQVTVAMQEEHGLIKAVGKMSHDRFGLWVEKKRKEGWEIYSCYEAGASGYWLHRELVEMGVKNLVVAAKAMGRDKGQKTDRRDSGELVDGLDRYLRGNKTALNPVAVPSPELEQNRAVVRYHRQLMADRSRYDVTYPFATHKRRIQDTLKANDPSLACCGQRSPPSPRARGRGASATR
jgi:hypothetical protein